MEKLYCAAMDKAKKAFDTIENELPEEAQYVVPMAYNMHWYFHVNLRSLQWLCELRSSSAGHPTYRFIAQEMAKQVISQNGAWTHVGTSWAVIKTVSGPNRAVGTQAGTGAYDDSYAHLSGFRPNVMAQATIYKDPSIVSDPPGTHEAELHLRWADTASTARGYECSLAFDGQYLLIVRWNGALGDFSILSEPTSFPSGTMPPVTGDIFKATIIGSTINVYINKNDGHGDQLIGTASDSTWTDGNPGIGMWLNSPGTDQTRYGFTSYTVTELP